ncbi:MAG: plastocyanin/azurin family copper-binding protein [Haloarculaceae archaeon]
MDRRTFIRSLAVGGASAGATAGVGAATATPTPTNTSSSGSSNGSTTHTVEMWTKGGDYYFDPIGLAVDPGDTVQWVVKQGDHSATAYSDANDADQRIPDGAASFDSGVLETDGATFSHTFRATGTYDYFCTPHKQLGMVGRIVCGEPGGPAESGSIPNRPSSGLMPDADTIVEKGSVSFPYVPTGGGGSLPWQFWAATGGVGAAVVGMFSRYDRESGRYGEQNLHGPEE